MVLEPDEFATGQSWNPQDTSIIRVLAQNFERLTRCSSIPLKKPLCAMTRKWLLRQILKLS